MSAWEQGLSLTGPDGLLKQLTKTVLETALNQEMKPMPATERQQETGMAWPASSSPHNRCRPFPCTGLSPGSEYYGGSVAPQAAQPMTNLVLQP